VSPVGSSCLTWPDRVIYLGAYVALLAIAAALTTARYRTRPNGEITMDNPLTQLAMAAATTHEMYEAYVDAGFAPEQAMEIVKHALEIGARMAQENGQ
jgi:hypothetical protein